MKNPNPIERARRIEMRRKELGYVTRCFWCPETELACFQEDHPVTEKLDEEFKKVVCQNCHRKLEVDRDVKGLTQNGLHNVIETEREAFARYLRLLAEDQEKTAEHLLTAPPELVRKALEQTAASLRRKAKTLSSIDPALNPRILDFEVRVCPQSEMKADARQTRGRKRRAA